MSDGMQLRHRLADLLGETRGDGFEEFLAEFGKLPTSATQADQMVARFIRAIAVAIIETARLEEGGDTPEQSFEVIAAAYAACGYALPCMASCAVKADGMRDVLTFMKTYLDRMHEQTVDALEREAMKELKT